MRHQPQPHVHYYAAVQRATDGSPILPGAFYGVAVDSPPTDPRSARVFTTPEPAHAILATLPSRDMGGRPFRWEVAHIYTRGSFDHWYDV